MSAGKREQAVALLYDGNRAAVPKVVAKGSGLVARKIIEAARAAGVHVREDPDLLELLAKVEVGDEIPPEMYQAVAEVLAFVYAVNERFKHKIRQQ